MTPFRGGRDGHAGGTSRRLILGGLILLSTAARADLSPDEQSIVQRADALDGESDQRQQGERSGEGQKRQERGVGDAEADKDSHAGADGNRRAEPAA